MGEWRDVPGRPSRRKYRDVQFTRGAAALILGSALAASAAAQAPAHTARPAPAPAGAPPGPPPASASLDAAVTPMTKPEVRPDRHRRHGQRPADPRGRGLPRAAPVPAGPQEMARKEILAAPDRERPHRPVPQRASRSRSSEKEVDKLIDELKAELTKAKKDYAKELEAMMLTEAEFRAEVARADEVGEVRQAAGDRRGAEATVRRAARTCSTARWSAPGTSC